VSDYKKMFEPYSINGFIHPVKGQESGNGWLYTAETVVVTGKNYPPPHDLLMASLDHEIVAGLLMRTTRNGFGQESIDDYVGAGAMSYLYGLSLALNILAYGKLIPATYLASDATFWDRVAFRILGQKIRYVYNNIESGTFTLRAWLGRFQHLIGFLEFCAGKRPPWWRRAWMAVCFLLPASKKNHDRWIIPWVMSVILKECGTPMIRLALRFWSWRARRNFGTVGALLHDYFAKDEPHPLELLTRNMDF